MGRPGPFLIFLLAAVGAWLLFSRAQGNRQTVAAPPPETAAAEPPPPPPRPPISGGHGTAFHASVGRAGENPFAQPPQDNVIPFKVVDGQAIAFGDQILGTPEQPEIREGFYDASAPQLWDGNEIPYFINSDLPHPERVEKALQYLQESSGVHFVAYNGQPDVIVFAKGDHHCYSLLGRMGGQQPISLSDGCQWQEIMHETLHTLGFVHEQSRYDRDKYVTIQWENIDKEYQDQYAIVPQSFMKALADSPFDPRSIMLYRPDSFARQPGLLTMLPRGSFALDPVSSGLSPEDVRRLERLFPR